MRLNAASDVPPEDELLTMIHAFKNHRVTAEVRYSNEIFDGNVHTQVDMGVFPLRAFTVSGDQTAFEVGARREPKPHAAAAYTHDLGHALDLIGQEISQMEAEFITRITSRVGFFAILT